MGIDRQEELEAAYGSVEKGLAHEGDFRIHFAYDEMPPEIALALKHFREIQVDPFHWASFECNQFANYRTAYLYIGVIHSNGFKERHQTIRSYYMEKGVAKYHDYAVL